MVEARGTRFSARLRRLGRKAIPDPEKKGRFLVLVTVFDMQVFLRAILRYGREK